MNKHTQGHGSTVQLRLLHACCVLDAAAVTACLTHTQATALTLSVHYQPWGMQSQEAPLCLLLTASITLSLHYDTED